MTIEISLSRGTWRFDPNKPLGEPGGFGQVFEGISQDGTNVAVKLLKIDKPVHREIKIAEELNGRTFENVIPYLDSGWDKLTENYYLVMILIVI